MNVNKTGAADRTPYMINNSGDIQLNSIKDSSILEIASKCDYDKNGLLENKEIDDFLKEHGALSYKSSFSVYQEQTDESGNLVEQCIVSKKDGTQLKYSYEYGRAVSLVITKPNGEEHHMNLKDGSVFYYENQNDTSRHSSYQLNERNLNRFRNLGETKPNKFDEFVARLLRWDWKWW